MKWPGITHFPTLFLLVGYPLYWLELYWISPHKAFTSPAAWIIFLLLFLIIFKNNLSEIGDSLNKLNDGFKCLDRWTKNFIFAGGGLCFLILLCGLYASRLPPHLSQEFDMINYHITIPRQHLLAGSFQHLRWSAADLLAWIAEKTRGAK